jgi:hypothetical protein
VRRSPSPRELVASLVACVESESDDDQELQQLLASYSPAMAESLGVTVDDIDKVAELTPEARRYRVRGFVRLAKERQQAVHASAVQNLSLAAAAMLAQLARWTEGRIELDTRIVLGRNLLADRTRKYIRFDVEGREPVSVRRAKLHETGQALRFSEVSCWLERSELRFGWRAGKGGLRLVTQCVEAKERDAVMSVVIQRPRAHPVESVQAAPLQRRSNWFGDVVSELNMF